jgi:hypothetical protein
MLLALLLKRGTSYNLLLTLLKWNYHGKSTILFGSVAKAYFPEAKVYAIDLMTANWVLPTRQLRSFPCSLEAFNRNVNNGRIIWTLFTIIRDQSFMLNGMNQFQYCS